MTELSRRSFKRVKYQKKKIHGKLVDVVVFQRGGFKVEVTLNKIDQIDRLTTSPKRWLNTNPVIPIGRRDENGLPIYKVVRLDKHIAKMRKTSRHTR